MTTASRFSLLVPFLSYPLLLPAQPPAIAQEGIRNLASQMPPSLPGGALSPGGLFSVRGLRLGGVTTQIFVRQGDADREAAVRALQPEYLEARVPLGLAGGEAELRVVRDGEASRPLPDSHRTGRLRNLQRKRKRMGARGRPRRIQVGSAWSAAPDLPVSRSSRSGSGGVRSLDARGFPVADKPGVDEVRFTLAPSTPSGCFVPVLVKTEAGVSNAVTLPVSAQGRPCPETLGAAPDALILLARLGMRVRLVGGAPADFNEEIGAALFPRDRGSPLLVGWRQLPPAGTCTSYSGNWISDSSSGGISGFLFASSGTGRDAGAGIRVAGPSGDATLNPRVTVQAFTQRSSEADCHSRAIPSRVF